MTPGEIIRGNLAFGDRQGVLVIFLQIADAGVKRGELGVDVGMVGLLFQALIVEIDEIGHLADRFFKRDLLVFLDESDGVAAGPTDEAFENLLFFEMLSEGFLSSWNGQSAT
jgi:hypothetical protein